MRTRHLYLMIAFTLAFHQTAGADQPAQVTEVFRDVEHGPQTSAISSPASKGTLIPDGEYVQTGSGSRAELLLPSTDITRLGANTIYNYSVETNTVDLEQGTILFCKPKDARQTLSIKTAAVTAGITGTTGFMSIQGSGSKKTYIFGIIEGHAIAYADDHPFLVGAGDILEFRAGTRPFLIAYDVPRFVKSSPLLRHFQSTLPNQSEIDRELADYADEVSRGFIVPPSKTISYSGDVPLLPTAAYDSAQNAQGQSRTGSSSFTPAQTTQSSPPSGSQPYSGGNGR
jgi:hypothetical protein